MPRKELKEPDYSSTIPANKFDYVKLPADAVNYKNCSLCAYYRQGHCGNSRAEAYTRHQKPNDCCDLFLRKATSMRMY